MLPLPPGLLKEIADAGREGKAAAATGAHVRLERSVSTKGQLIDVIDRLTGPVHGRSSAVDGSWSFTTPTAAGHTTVQTIGIWHCDEGSGSTVDDASANGNDLTLTNVSWTTGKFDDGLSFNGTSSKATVTLASTEPVRKFLYFAAWINPTSGPLFTWDGVMEVYISGGSLVAEIEGTTYTGPALGSGWQLAHVQFNNGKVFVGVDDVIWEFTHGDTSLAPSAWAVEIGKRDSTYYSGAMDEIRLVADVVVEEDWGKRYYQAQDQSILYCLFDLGSGTSEHHHDFLGPTVSLVNTTWQTGYLGNAIRFNGTTAYASFTPSAMGSAGATDELTIEMVVKFASLDACTLIDQTDGLNLAWDGTHLVAALQGVTNPASQVGPLNILVDTWYNVALTYDGAVKAVWLNGQKTGEVAATGTVVVPQTEVRIGSTIAGASFFKGDLDFLHVANAVLKPQNRPRQRFVLGLHGFEASEDWVLMDD